MWPQLSHTTDFKFCTTSESFYVNLNYSGSVVIKKKILKELFHWNTCKIVSHIVAPPDPQGPWL
jgi:hypothetical protein